MHFHIKNSLRAYHRTQYNRVECDGAKFHVNLIREKHRENYWTAFLLLSSFNQCVPVSLSHYFISSYRLLFRSHWKWYFDVVAVTLYSSDHNLNLNCDALREYRKKIRFRNCHNYELLHVYWIDFVCPHFNAVIFNSSVITVKLQRANKNTHTISF